MASEQLTISSFLISELLTVISNNAVKETDFNDLNNKGKTVTHGLKLAVWPVSYS
jgi:hypothetical protein